MTEKMKFLIQEIGAALTEYDATLCYTNNDDGIHLVMANEEVVFDGTSKNLWEKYKEAV